MNFRESLDEADLEALVAPCLRMFFSVDVVGSTAFKQKSHIDDGRPWLTFLHGFFTGFPATFTQQVGKYVEEHQKQHDPNDGPALWKALGDELVFTVPLKHKSQPIHYLSAFRNALIATIKYNLESRNPLPVSFKGTVWLAGFPVWNSAVPLAGNEPISATSVDLDFVGPLMDIGFRLAKLATPHRLIVSADLAWLIANHAETADVNFHYQGTATLKGVLQDTPYPVFWVDCYHGDAGKPSFAGFNKAEDELLAHRACKPKEIVSLMDAFFEAHPDEIPKPFIPDHGVPCHHDKFEQRRDEVKEQLRRIYQAGSSSDPTGDSPENIAGTAATLAKRGQKAKPRLNSKKQRAN